MSETLEQVLGKRSKMAKDMCDNILCEIDRALDGERWQRTREHLGDENEDTKKIIWQDAEQKLARIKNHEAEYFNSDDTFIYEVQKAVQVGGDVRQQHASLFELCASALASESPELPESPLARSTRSLMQTFRDVEAAKNEVEVTLMMPVSNCPITLNDMWLPEVLGFIHRDNGCFEVSPAKEYKDKFSRFHTNALAMLGLGGEVKAGHILETIDGDRDLLQKFCEIETAYRWNSALKVRLSLGRRYPLEEARQVIEDVLSTVKNEDGVKEGALKFAHLLDLNPMLKDLHLARLKLGDDAGVAFAEGLVSNSTVHTVDLVDNKFGANAGAALARVLRNGGASGLKRLLLDDNDFGASSRELVEALAAHSSLTELSLHRCRLSDEAGAAFAEGLGGNSTLDTVNLDGNCLGDVAGGALAHALRCGAASGLRTLSLLNNEDGLAKDKELQAAWDSSLARDPKKLVLYVESDIFLEDPASV